MTSLMKRTLVAGLVMATFATLHAGSARTAVDHPIQRGDKVLTDMTCRTSQGLVLTTVASVAKDTSLAKTDIFMGMDPYAPIELIAGSGYGGPTLGSLVPLASAVGAEASKALTGMIYGESRTVHIKAEANEKAPAEERFSTLSRVSWQPRTVEVPTERVKADLGRDPKPGEVLHETADSKTFIEKVAQDKATIRVEIRDGAIVPHTLGKAKVRTISQDKFEYFLQVREGDVLAMGSLLAKVIKVDEQTFTVDFGNPLAGLELECEVRPVRAAEGAQ